jgi:putative phosphoribosyl transferase
MMPLRDPAAVPFTDRADAGRRLARELARFGAERPVVLGLPRGGVVVAGEVARALDAPLDVWIVRKIGAPGYPELGIGAISEGGLRVVDRGTADSVGASDADIERIAQREAAEVERRVRLFRGDREPPDVRGRTVIVVDDGIATGVTVRAALRALRQRAPRRLVLAVPVGAPESLRALLSDVDELVCLEAPARLRAVGQHYRDFRQVEDDEVLDVLERERRRWVGRVRERRAS